MYGNAVSDELKAEQQWRLPRELARLNSGFSLERTRFYNDVDKTGTSRRAIGMMIPSGDAFTFEVSFFGQTMPEMTELVPFSQRDYIMLGVDLGRALYFTYAAEQ
ncbi:uncharacterized protein MONBRDRAFT_9277 [Monosiga brevicollis MX1]|uniref:Uncharacterized protein n=1 Tax=Monosiga brevicollis TaxID=81824 RepID=A9V2M4_MONBE|nr:uncharacterized protein MONBRDRAFT_9277 [Monosiga brevicollis MX1]EDQ88284.1 predicted protein [Monosiga brevicollis MX1]|eukprot:XP_001746877.1 hypothetical protein [Monosiga brevicollis MX1]